MPPLSPMSMAMLLRRMNTNVTVHGFRRSARTWMTSQGVPFELAEEGLAHTVGNANVQAYQRSLKRISSTREARGGKPFSAKLAAARPETVPPRRKQVRRRQDERFEPHDGSVETAFFAMTASL
jgi:hypothetical protein